MEKREARIDSGATSANPPSCATGPAFPQLHAGKANLLCGGLHRLCLAKTVTCGKGDWGLHTKIWTLWKIIHPSHHPLFDQHLASSVGSHIPPKCQGHHMDLQHASFSLQDEHPPSLSHLYLFNLCCSQQPERMRGAIRNPSQTLNQVLLSAYPSTSCYCHSCTACSLTADILLPHSQHWLFFQ